MKTCPYMVVISNHRGKINQVGTDWIQQLTQIKPRANSNSYKKYSPDNLESKLRNIPNSEIKKHPVVLNLIDQWTRGHPEKNKIYLKFPYLKKALRLGLNFPFWDNRCYFTTHFYVETVVTAISGDVFRFWAKG